MKAKMNMISRHSTMPNSSPATEKTKSAWLSGMTRLTVPSPGPTPNQPPWMMRLAAHVDLERVALAGQEAVDAAGDVREDRIGGERAADAGRAERDDPQPRHAGHEEHGAPGAEHQHRLAEVGLRDQQRQHQRRAG